MRHEGTFASDNMKGQAGLLVEHYRELPHEYRECVYELLDSCEGEFVPPLSQRRSTHQTTLSGLDDGTSGSYDGIRDYFDEMATQAFLLSFWDEKREGLAAFLSYVPGFVLPYGLLDVPTAYVSTICTDKAWRNRGIARELYTKLETETDDSIISLRTWSTNKSQIHLLRSLGYRELFRIENDRGTGIDTVYFMKEVGAPHE